MLAFMRRVFIGSWLGRILAVVIFLSFAAWGVGDFVTGLAGVSAGNVASVAGHAISEDEFRRVYQRGLTSAAQNQGAADPSAIPYGERREIAAQALQQLVFQAVVANAAARVGVVVPDQVVREQIFADKQFQGSDGRFSRPLFDQALQNAGFTEAQVLALFRAQSAALALIEPMRVGGMAPPELVRRAFAYGGEQRILDVASLPFSAIPVPAAPDEATLRRFYDNNKDRYVTPEYRRIKLVLLSPQTIGHTADVSEADERKYYDELSARYQVPEKRSVQVLILPDEAQANRAAQAWQAGEGWAQLQAANKGATPIELDGASQASIPSTQIAALAFSTRPGVVAGPQKAEAGWVILRVLSVTPPVDRKFEQVRDELHDMIGQQRAMASLSSRVQRLQDAIAGGGLDSIPGDIGAAATEGSLDAQGLTRTGEPAPLPGSDAVRKAVIAQAFDTRPGQAPTLIQGPENSWYALSVESVEPAAPLAFVQAADRVRADWQQDAVRHADEQKAAALYAQADARGGLSALAAAQPGSVPNLSIGLAVRRGQSDGSVPQNLAQLAFGLKPGTSTMLDTPDGFVVATLTGIRRPDPATDPLGYGRARAALDAAMADDIENSYVSALRDRAHPSLDGKAIDRVVGAPGGGDASGSGS